MAKNPSKKFEFRETSGFGQSQHDWNTILDGEARIYLQGTAEEVKEGKADFTGKAQNWPYQCKQQGAKRGLDVKTMVLTAEEKKQEKIPETTVAVAVQADLDTTPERAAELKEKRAKQVARLKELAAAKKAKGEAMEDEGDDDTEE